MSKLHSININRVGWNILVWGTILVGTAIFTIFNSSFFIPKDYWQFSLIASTGGILIGFGFGLVYARMWKIRGIDK